MIPFITLWHYFRIRRLRFANREMLEAYQVKNSSSSRSRYWLTVLGSSVMPHSLSRRGR